MDSPVLWGLKAEECSMNRKLILPCVFALTLSIGAWAQGGVFQRGRESVEFQNGGAAILTNQGFGNPIDGSDVTNQTFGNPTEGVNVTNQTFGAPLGNGLLTLLLASAGYVAAKSNKRNNKSKKEYIR